MHTETNKLILKTNKSHCPWTQRFKKVYVESELTPNGLCLLAFHAVYPYYLTLTNGGWFKWVKPNDGVIVQCPNPEGAVEMKIFLCDSKKSVRVEVIKARGNCPKGYKNSDVFILGPKTFTFCPKALDAFIPYIMVFDKKESLHWEGQDANNVLTCPHTNCGNVQFKVSKD